jgi:aminomethyltransferase
MNTALKRTSLHGFHLDHGARMVPFAGWEMPVQYTSILEEHLAVRQQAGLFDVSHMGQLRVHGPQAREFLDQILSCDIDRLYIGRAAYGILCQDDGGCVDDIIVYQIEDEEFFLCVNAANREKDFLWISRLATSLDCRVDDVSDSFALLALQGPIAIELFEKVTDHSLDGLKRFHATPLACLDTRILVSRTGYTGEDGLELYFPASEGPRVANLIYESGKEAGLRLVGLGARDSLRLEAGFPLYGHELSEEIDLLTAGLGFAAKLETGKAFVGSQQLLKNLTEGLRQRVIHFILDDRRLPRPGYPVCDRDGTACGKVLSGAHSPVLGKPIGSALVDRTALDERQPLAVAIRNDRVPLRVQRPPLHKAQG